MATICIIVPVYKAECYLDKCINSIINQTYSDFELILVDDGSPDKSGIICDQYAELDSRIVVLHQSNRGAASARNAGLDWVYKYSSAEWITFADSDDWLHSRYLEILYQSVLTHHTAVAKCMYLPVNQEIEDDIIGEFTTQTIPTEDAYLLPNSGVAPYAKLYRRDCFATIRYPEDKYAEDMFTTYRVLFQQNNIAVVNLPLYYYRYNPNSLTNAAWSSKQLDEFEAFDIQLDYFDSRGLYEVRNKLAGRYLWAIGRQYNMLPSDKFDEKAVFYRKYMRKKMRTVIRKYNTDARFFIKEYVWCYEIAYPKCMWIYWNWKALLRKLRIIK